MAKKRTGESLKELFKGEVESKALKRQGAKTLKDEEKKPRHTIYLSPEVSRKLRLYAAEHRMRLNEVIEELIHKNL